MYIYSMYIFSCNIQLKFALVVPKMKTLADLKDILKMFFCILQVPTV